MCQLESGSLGSPVFFHTYLNVRPSPSLCCMTHFLLGVLVVSSLTVALSVTKKGKLELSWTSACRRKNVTRLEGVDLSVT